MPAPAGAGCNVWWWLQLVNPWNNGNKFSPKIVKFMLRFLDCAIDSWLQRAVLEVPCLRASVQWELVIMLLKMALVVAGAWLGTAAVNRGSAAPPNIYQIQSPLDIISMLGGRSWPPWSAVWSHSSHATAPRLGATCHYHGEYRHKLFSRIRSSPILAVFWAQLCSIKTAFNLAFCSLLCWLQFELLKHWWDSTEQNGEAEG